MVSGAVAIRRSWLPLKPYPTGTLCARWSSNHDITFIYCFNSNIPTLLINLPLYTWVWGVTLILITRKTHQLPSGQILQIYHLSLWLSLLSQYSFCAGGVLGGAAYGMKMKKGMLPMVAAGVAGSVADLVYGYVSACEKEVKIYEQSLRASDK